MARRISAIIALDGEKEFKQAVMNANKELANLKSQSKLTKEEFDGQANSLKALSTKHELLSKVLETHKKKENELQKGLENARNTYEKYGADLEKLKVKYRAATEKMQQMESSSQTTKKQLEAQRKEVERLADGVKGSEERYQTAANRIQEWESKLNTAKAQTIKANKELEQNKKYLDEAEHSTDKCAKSIDEYGKKIKEAVNVTFDWGSAIKEAVSEKALDTASDLVKELGEATIGAAKDYQTASNQIQASTGASALSMKEYRDVLEDVYKNNYGDDFSDVADTISLVAQNMDNLSKADLQKVTEGAITLRDTFDMDLNETIRGANGLIENMGLNATEAFDLIAKGAQNGLNKSGELGDNLAEYSQIWGQAGFSAEKMFAILDNGLDSGAYNLDKVNDFIKEFTISLSDGRIEDGLSNFSAKTQNLFYQWQSGGATAAQVFESVIADLAGMTNQQEALTIASNTWSALGEDNAMKVITSLNNVNDTYKNVKGTMTSIQNIKYDDVTNQLTETARIIQMKIAEPLAKECLPKVNDGLELVGDNIELISAASLGLGALIAANRAKETKLGQEALKVLKLVFMAKETENIATEAGTAATAKRTVATLSNTAATIKQTAATKMLAAQQKAYNAIASLNPLGKATLVIAGAVAAYKALEYAVVETDKELVQNREEVKALCDEYDSLKSSIDSAAQGRKETIDGITAEYTGYHTMSEKLVELAEKENKTSGEMALMHEYVNQLNEAMPTLNLAIDEQTGNLNMSTEAIHNQVEAIKEKAHIAAYEEMLTELLKEQASAEMELTKLEQERNDVVKRKQELEEKYAQTYSATMGRQTYLSVEYAIKLKELNDEESNLEERIADCNETIKESGRSYDLAVEKISGVTDETGDAADGMGGLAKQSDEAANSMGVFADAEKNAAANTTVTTQEQAVAYQKLKEAVAASIEESISMFDKFSGGEKISANDILSNLNSQIDGMTKWAANMQTLAGAAGEGMTEEFYNYLVEMGPESANLVQTLVNTLNGETGKFTEICNSWTEAMNLDEEFAGEITSGYQAAQEAIEKGKAGTMGAALKAQEETQSKVGTWMAQNSRNNMELEKKYGMANVVAQSEGMKDGLPEVETASQTVADTVIKPLETVGDEVYKQGANVSAQYAQGINDNANLVSAAIQNIAKLTKQLNGIGSKNTGTGAGTGSTSGSSGASGGASGGTVSSNPKGAQIQIQIPTITSQADEQNKEAENFGANITQGITAGILSEVKGAKESMTEVCEKVFESGGSQVRKFADAIGKMISESVAFGIAAKKGQAIKNAKSLADDVYKAAVTWILDYKKTNEISIEDEKYFWEQLSKTVKKGTDAYNKAVKNLNKIEKYQKTVNTQIKKSFGVSWYDDKGEKKKAEDYYNDLYQAASKYFSNYSVLHDMSLQEEEYYWQQVLARMKKGTQGYIDAKKQLKEVQAQIKEQVAAEKEENKEYALSGGALEAYKTYYNVSLKAEMQYWATVRKKFKEGTAERIEADQKYYEAKDAYNEKLEELNEEYYENCKEVNEKLEEEIQSLTDAYKDAVAERKDAIYDSFGLFDTFKSTSVSGGTLLYNLQTQVAGYADWEKQLNKLSGKGILSDTLMQELADMGPEASASLHALNQLSEAQLREYEQLWEQKNALAEAQAVKENEQLRQETQAQIDALKNAAQAEIDAYTQAYQEALAEVNTSIEAPLKELAKNATKIGEDAIAALIAGYKDKATAKDTKADLKSVNTQISTQLGKLEKAGKEIGNNTLQGLIDGLTNKKKINNSAKSLVNSLKTAIQKEADIHSPSRLFRREVGVHIGDGVALGIEDEQKTVNKAGTEMIRDLLKQQEAEMQKQQQELQAYAASVCSKAGIAELNELVSVAPVQQVTAQVDNTNMLTMMQEMLVVMQEGFTQMANMQIVADTGALIGETSAGMSEQLAASFRRMRK